MFNELKNLKKLNNASEKELKSMGLSPEILKNRIEKEKVKILKELNILGWILVIILIFPLALMELGMDTGDAAATSIAVTCLVSWVIYKITGKLI